MKIEDKDLLSSLQNLAKTGAGNTSVRSNSSAKADDAPGDNIDLTSHGQAFAGAFAAGEAARAGRVSQLQQLYLSGQYQVDSNELSGAIIDAHLAGI